MYCTAELNETSQQKEFHKECKTAQWHTYGHMLTVHIYLCFAHVGCVCVCVYATLCAPVGSKTVRQPYVLVVVAKIRQTKQNPDHQYGTASAVQ